MKRKSTYLIAAFAYLAVCLSGCQSADNSASKATADNIPVHVEIQESDEGYQLYINKEPFYIKGAGLEFGSIEELAANGANSFRTWRTDNGRDSGQEVLDRAHENGLMVTMGLEIAREREGTGRGYFDFDYNDEVAVAEQLERVRAEVMQYKDHPALMIWSIGNELNHGATNPKVWDAVNEISEMIHEIDPHHLTTTTLAGINPNLAAEVKARAPDLDLVSIQMYADIINLPTYLAEMGWEGPYMVTEWGATGHWEVNKTPWDAPIETHSSTKADLYMERYNVAIESQKELCVGSYVFLWGQKQERTPTWYGMFLPTGEKTEAVDVMHYAWKGEWPENRSPRLESATLDGKTAYDGVYLDAGEAYEAAVQSTDPDNDALTYVWEIRAESQAQSEGGDDEYVPELYNGLIDDPSAATVSVTAPTAPGAYRLFIYIYDGQGHAAHANIPFYVNA
ncbi:MAG: glycoside hydrolase family 2 TIM barrel-domain containing protein [Bacteroidota bacterium]